MESLKFTIRNCIFRFHRANLRPWWTDAQLTIEELQLSHRTRGQRLHAPVRQIPHPPGELQLARHPQREVAIPYALHLT